MAPLLYSRFAALVARLLAGMISLEKGGHQVYLDDSFWMLQGTLRRRSTTLAAVLMTMLALGAKLSLGKGCRSRSVDWIGVKFTLVDEDTLVLSLPERFLEEMGQLLKSWENKGYAAVKELRQAAGKSAWLAGILPRVKWVTAVLYAVLTQTLKEEADKEGQRRRDRKGLFAVKRLELARLWMIQFLAVAKQRPTRRIDLRPKTAVEVRLMTDASPEGLGGVLAINGRIVEVFSCKVTKKIAEELLVEHMASSSQAVMETLAMLVALRRWINKFKGYKIEIAVQADSTAALAVSQKLAGKSTAGDGYLIEAKLLHIEGGHGWNDQLDRCFKQCKRALARGKGPGKKAPEVPLERRERPLKPPWDRNRSLVKFGVELFLFAMTWMLRELEVVTMDTKDVQFRLHQEEGHHYHRHQQDGPGIQRGEENTTVPV